MNQCKTTRTLPPTHVQSSATHCTFKHVRHQPQWQSLTARVHQRDDGARVQGAHEGAVHPAEPHTGASNVCDKGEGVSGTMTGNQPSQEDRSVHRH